MKEFVSVEMAQLYLDKQQLAVAASIPAVSTAAALWLVALPLTVCVVFFILPPRPSETLMLTQNYLCHLPVKSQKPRRTYSPWYANDIVC